MFFIWIISIQNKQKLITQLHIVFHVFIPVRAEKHAVTLTHIFIDTNQNVTK